MGSIGMNLDDIWITPKNKTLHFILELHEYLEPMFLPPTVELWIIIYKTNKKNFKKKP